MKAKRLQRVDKDLDIHLQAWKNQEVQATKKRGKKTVPYYSNFEEFFNYEDKTKEILTTEKEEEPPLSKLETLMLQANS